MKFSVVTSIALVVSGWATGAVRGAIILDFDYTYDTSSFFGSGTEARSTLMAAGAFFEGILSDELSDLTPGGSNVWSAVFADPATGDVVTVPNRTIPADTLVIYVGARNLSGTALGRAGPGGFAASGSSSWVSRVSTRGETGNDFGPWGGSLAVDASATWHLDWNTNPGAGQNDLYSVLLHEIAHILGFGLADSWANYVDAGGDLFQGPASTSELGGNVPLVASDEHWAEGTTSTVYGTGTSQEAAMDPTLSMGTRKLLTALDVAALSDIGWDIAPVPETVSPSLLAACLVFATVRWGRRMAIVAG